VLVRPDGRIVLLDFGMIGTLLREQRFALSNIFFSLGNKDARGMALNLRKLAVDGDLEMAKAMEMDLSQLITDFVIFSDAEAELSELVVRLQKIIYKYQLAVPGVVFLILRALAILEGIGRKLYPDLDILSVIKPYGMRLFKEQLAVDNLGMDAYYSAVQIGMLLYNLPAEVLNILRKLRMGKTLIQLEHKGMPELLHTIDAGINRISLTLITASLLLGTSIVVALESPDAFRPFGLSFTGLIGYTLSAFLSVVLFFYSIRNGK
jgi:ubiquinone biosynthesis protein